MSDDIWIKHNLGTFQQPYIFQQNRNRQTPVIAQKVGTTPAIARQPSTYQHRVPTTYRNPVNAQEPNIRSAQEPNIRSAQEPNIRDGQTPFTYNYRSPGTYRVPVDYQTPFTYDYRSPGTYRSPVVYQLPFSYNYRSPGTYRSSVSKQSPFTYNVQTSVPYSFQAPYSFQSSYSYRTPVIFTQENEIVRTFQGSADDAYSFGGESESSVRLFGQIYKTSSTGTPDIIVAGEMNITGTDGDLKYRNPLGDIIYQVVYSAGSSITTTGTDPTDKVYELDDSLSTSYTVRFNDNTGLQTSTGGTTGVPDISGGPGGLFLQTSGGLTINTATAIPVGVNNSLNFSYTLTSFNGVTTNTNPGSFFTLTFAASGQTTYTYNGYISFVATSQFGGGPGGPGGGV